MDKIVRYSKEVREALQTNNKPVVALESTIITHGMPYPQNLETALSIEQIVRDNGAIPATIALKNGFVHIGLEHEELEELAKCHNAVKVSTRDLSYVLTKKMIGSTTVATTSRLAHMSGIRIFVTGGIGGVHRGVAETWDISNDLVELGQIPICVVCAGAKSILDLPKTIEFLETEGVPVLGFQTDTFPAFFTRNSGLKCAPADDEQFIADMMYNQFNVFNLSKGIVLGNPIKAEDEASSQIIEDATRKALEEATAQNISGRDITPFLLKRIAEVTNNVSLDANIQLIRNNAEVGAKIAVLYHKKL